MTSKNGNWKILSHKLVTENHWTKIYNDEVIEPGGRKGSYIYAERFDAVYVIAQDNDKSVYLIKEYKYAAKDLITRVPAGSIENGQEPIDAAKKELYEETGIKAKKWKLLGSQYSAPGFITTRQNIFLATDLDISEIGDHSEGNEDISKVWKVSFDELKKMIANSEINEALSLAALSLIL